MPEEIGLTLKNLNNLSEKKFGDLKIFSGEWQDKDSDNNYYYVSVAWSGWGKVCAARAATRLLAFSHKEKSVDFLLFTGVAGAANLKLKQWDIVIPNELIQHDMDASPLFPKYVIPILNKSKIDAISSLVNWATSSFQEFQSEIFGHVENGLVATGDKFIADKTYLNKLCKDLPGLQAVEMEGAAVAQIAYQENIPWLIIRVISDSADNSAVQNFSEFLKEYEKRSWELIEVLLKKLNESPLLKIN